MINPPKANPNKLNESPETSPRYSGERNKKVIPKDEPNLSPTIKKRINQKTSENRLSFKWAMNNRKGKNALITSIKLQS